MLGIRDRGLDSCTQAESACHEVGAAQLSEDAGIPSSAPTVGLFRPEVSTYESRSDVGGDGRSKRAVAAGTSAKIDEHGSPRGSIEGRIRFGPVSRAVGVELPSCPCRAEAQHAQTNRAVIDAEFGSPLPSTKGQRIPHSRPLGVRLWPGFLTADVASRTEAGGQNQSRQREVRSGVWHGRSEKGSATDATSTGVNFQEVGLATPEAHAFCKGPSRPSATTSRGTMTLPVQSL